MGATPAVRYDVLNFCGKALFTFCLLFSPEAKNISRIIALKSVWRCLIPVCLFSVIFKSSFHGKEVLVQDLLVDIAAVQCFGTAYFTRSYLQICI